MASFQLAQPHGEREPTIGSNAILKQGIYGLFIPTLHQKCSRNHKTNHSHQINHCTTTVDTNLVVVTSNQLQMRLPLKLTN